MPLPPSLLLPTSIPFQMRHAPMSLVASRLYARFLPPVHSFASALFSFFLVRDVVILQRTLFATSHHPSTQTSFGLQLLPASYAIPGGPIPAAFILIFGIPSLVSALVIFLTIPSLWQGWPRQFPPLVSTRVFPFVPDALSGVTQSLLVSPHAHSVLCATAPTPRTIINPWRNVVRVLPRQIPLFLPLGKGFHALTPPLV